MGTAAEAEAASEAAAGVGAGRRHRRREQALYRGAAVRSGSRRRRQRRICCVWTPGWCKLEKAEAPPRSGGLGAAGGVEGGGSAREVRKKRHRCEEEVEASSEEVSKQRHRCEEEAVASSEESSTARSTHPHQRFRMDGSYNSVADGSQRSQGYYPPMNTTSYHGPPPPGWNQYMFPMQGHPPTMYPPGTMYPQPFQHPPPHGTMYPLGSTTLDHTVPPVVAEEDEVEVVPEEEAVAAFVKRGRTKLGNFNPQEDIYLVKAWLEISCDPIIGNSQRGDSFWKRVVERYNFRRGTFSERTRRSLSSHWNNNIKPQVSLFAGYYAAVHRENPSGMSDPDKTSAAASRFAAGEKHAFGYFHCWDLLKDEPKWCDPTDPGAATEGGLQGDISLDSNRVNNDADKSTGKRPIGRDKAKAAAKKCKSTDTSSSDYASRMQDLEIQKISLMQEETQRKGERFQQLASIDEKRYQETLSHNQAMIAIERDKMKLKRDKHEFEREREEKQEDERILSINLDECNPALRMYYEARQHDILQKLAARRQRQQGP